MTQDDSRGSSPSIVGGQPQGGRGVEPATLPVGVEQVLYLAVSDPTFREALLADRRSAVAEHGLELQPSEEAVLFGVPAATLEAMLDNFRVSDHKRRSFMKAVAATTAGAAGAVMLDGCWVDTGARPDVDAEVPPTDGTVDASALEDVPAVTGIRPEPPPPETDEPEEPHD